MSLQNGKTIGLSIMLLHFKNTASGGSVGAFSCVLQNLAYTCCVLDIEL